MPFFDAICNTCGEITPDVLWSAAGPGDPCAACGSSDLRKSFDWSRGARGAAGIFEPIEVMDHLTGHKVIARSHADLQTLADRQAQAEGKPPGTYTPVVRSQQEQADRRHALSNRLYEARRSSGLPTHGVR